MTSLEETLNHVTEILKSGDDDAESVHHQSHSVMLAQLVLMRALLIEVVGLRADIATELASRGLNA